MQVDNRIRQCRRTAGLGLDEVADRCGVDSSTVHRWETGDIQITATRAAELAALFGVEVGYLMGWTEAAA